MISSLGILKNQSKEKYNAFRDYNSRKDVSLSFAVPGAKIPLSSSISPMDYSIAPDELVIYACVNDDISSLVMYVSNGEEWYIHHDIFIMSTIQSTGVIDINNRNNTGTSINNTSINYSGTSNNNTGTSNNADNNNADSPSLLVCCCCLESVLLLFDPYTEFSPYPSAILSGHSGTLSSMCVYNNRIYSSAGEEIIEWRDIINNSVVPDNINNNVVPDNINNSTDIRNNSISADVVVKYSLGVDIDQFIIYSSSGDNIGLVGYSGSRIFYTSDLNRDNNGDLNRDDNVDNNGDNSNNGNNNGNSFLFVDISNCISFIDHTDISVITLFDNILMVGLSDGGVCLYDIHSMSILERVEMHDGEINTIRGIRIPKGTNRDTNGNTNEDSTSDKDSTLDNNTLDNIAVVSVAGSSLSIFYNNSLSSHSLSTECYALELTEYKGRIIGVAGLENDRIEIIDIVEIISK